MAGSNDILIMWTNRGRNVEHHRSMTIPSDVGGKLRILPIYGENSPFNPEIRRHGDFVVASQRTSLGRLPNIETTYLDRQMLKGRLAQSQPTEPITTTLIPLELTNDVKARTLIRPVVRRTTIAYHDSSTPPQNDYYVTITRRYRQSP